MTDQINYWIEAIEAALDDAELGATTDQIKVMAECIATSHEMYSQHVGPCDVTVDSIYKDKLRELQSEVDRKQAWVDSTEPCPSCITTGIVLDSWDREQTCWRCDGRGRVPR